MRYPTLPFYRSTGTDVHAPTMGAYVTVAFTKRSLLLTAVVALLLFAPGCATNKPAVENNRDSVSSHNRENMDSLYGADLNQTDTPNISSPPPAPLSGDTTLGERLGQLDAMMRGAPPDSAEKLREEYQRLLSLYTGEPPLIQTGGSPEDRFSDLGDTLLPQSAASIPHRDDVTTPPTDSRPEREVKNQRAINNRNPARPNSTTVARNSGSKGVRPSMDSQAKRRAAPAAERGSQETQRQSSSESNTGTDNANRQLIDGIAATNAGRYDEAEKKLPAALSSRKLSRKNRTRGRYTYGESLEKSGKSAKAAKEYRKASGDGKGLAHKAYVAQCRALAKSGQRDRAKRLLIDFIKRNPSSAQVVNARQLLQTL